MNKPIVNLLQKAFIINWIANIYLVETIGIKKVKNISKRKDWMWLSRPWLYLTCHLGIISLLLWCLVMFMLATISRIILIGHDERKPVAGIRYFLFRAFLLPLSKAVVWTVCKQLFVIYPKPEVSYTEYLGPDWKPDYDKYRCGGIVMNHSHFIDSAVHCYSQLPSTIAKSEVRNFPFLGPMAVMSGCLFLDRSDKSNREQMKNKIIDK
jgi:hypothetical protein